MDESGLQFNMQRKRIYIRKAKRRAQIVTPDHRTSCTIVGTACADGVGLPPFVLLPENRNKFHAGVLRGVTLTNGRCPKVLKGLPHGSKVLFNKDNSTKS